MRFCFSFGSVEDVHKHIAAPPRPPLMTTSGMSRGVPYTASPVRGSAEPAVVTYNGYGSPTVPMYAPHAYPSAQASTVRTICISGFPQDVRERELHNLLFFLHGYQVSTR